MIWTNNLYILMLYHIQFLVQPYSLLEILVLCNWYYGALVATARDDHDHILGVLDIKRRNVK